MVLDPEAQALLEAVPFRGFHEIGVEEARKITDAGSALEGEPVATVEDLVVSGPAGDLPARLYRPSLDPGLPLVVYFHGGGFVVGGLGSHDALTRALANLSGCSVLAVEYRLAPEHPFPAAPDDAYAATTWAAEHAGELGADPARLGVAGDSAGGGLAAVVALDARDAEGPALGAQALIYPVTAHVTDDRSMKENVDAPLLPVADVQWYQDLYCARSGDVDHPRASPLRAESLAGLPPSLVVTAEHDPLRDQGDAYAARLAEAGVDVTHLPNEGMFHGFVNLAPFLPRGREVLEQVAAWLRERLGQGITG